MSALAGVGAVPGVTACALFDESGAPVEVHAAGREVDGEAMTAAMRALVEGMGLMGAPVGQAAEIYGETGTGWILGRRLGGLFILVLGEGQVRASLLEVALAILSARLRPSRGHGRRAAVATSQREPPGGGPVGVPALREVVRLLEARAGESARGHVKSELKALGESPRTLSRELFPQLVERLARYLPSPSDQERFRRAALEVIDVGPR